MSIKLQLSTISTTYSQCRSQKLGFLKSLYQAFKSARTVSHESGKGTALIKKGAIEFAREVPDKPLSERAVKSAPDPKTSSVRGPASLSQQVIQLASEQPVVLDKISRALDQTPVSLDDIDALMGEIDQQGLMTDELYELLDGRWYDQASDQAFTNLCGEVFMETQPDADAFRGRLTLLAAKEQRVADILHNMGLVDDALLGDDKITTRVQKRLKSIVDGKVTGGIFDTLAAKSESRSSD